jgi:mono/diheme cytochrome c family protein
MNRFVLVVIIIIILPLASGCKTKRSSTAQANDKSDSLEIAIADSLRQTDPWVKYSFVERQGKQLFDHYCAVCHGAKGEGDGFNSYNLDPKPHSLADSAYVAALSDATLAQVIALGGRGVNKSVLMPAYQNTLNQDKISYLVVYIRTF